MAASVLEVIITGDATRLSVALNQGAAQAKAFQGQMGGVGQSARSALGTAVPLGAAAAGVAVAAFAKQSFDAALEFDRSFTQIAALTNATSDQVDSMRQHVLALSGETAQAPQELAQSMYFLASSGLDAEQQMAALDASAKGSAVGLGEAGDLARITANALNVFADNGLEATDVMDTLTAAVREGSAEPDEFAGALGRVLPIADKAGISFQQVAASLATMSNAGLDVNEGVTALRGLLQSLVAPTQQTQDALAGIGLTVDDVVGSLQQNGLIDTLRMLDKAARENSSSTGEYNIIMRELVPNVRALTGAFNLTGQEAEKVDAIFQSVTDSTGDLGAAWDETQKSASFRFQQAMQQLSNVGQQLGASVLPLIADALGEVAAAVGPLAHGIDQLTAGFEELDRVSQAAEEHIPTAFRGASDGMRAFANGVQKLFLINPSGAMDDFKTAIFGADEATQALSKSAVGVTDTVSRVSLVVAGASRSLEGMAMGQQRSAGEAAAAATRYAALTSQLGSLSAIGVDVNGFLTDFRKKLEEADDKEAAFAEGLAEIASAAADWRAQTAESITGVGDVLSTLADKSHLTASDVVRAFDKAAAAAREFTADLVTIANTGGRTGKELANALLQMGPSAAGLADTVAGASEDMRGRMVESFGKILSAGQTGATQLQKALVPVLEDIRDVLTKIAKHWGIHVDADTSQAHNALTGLQQHISNIISGSPYKARMTLHTGTESPWPDEALRDHLELPIKALGFKRVGDKWTLPLEVGVHTLGNGIGTPWAADTAGLPQWAATAMHRLPRLPEGHTRIDPNLHGGRQRLLVQLDRQHFDRQLAYDESYRGF